MNKIELKWTEICCFNVNKEDVFSALVELYNSYAPEFDERFDYVQTVTEWLEDNLEDYVNEFLTKLALISHLAVEPMHDIDNENITALLDNKEFMNEFKEWLND